ncbi:SusD/RagB family nutrient-binding outer membrane lipoprotein [candidate division KSB1 bacterium]|nr:SusD/RagB family nutrient-binding outer membrane lipoprotein [candidate division KSB1 bacterium]
MKIKHTILLILAAFLVLLFNARCGKNFMENPEVQQDPNRAVEVSADQLFNAVQMKTFFQQENLLSRITSIWMQQMAGVDRQAAAYGKYLITDNTTSDEMNGFFIEGGLVDIKELKSRTTDAGNRVYTGIVKFYEAFNIGMASSLWGDFPYSEACGDVLTPKLDSQEEIYAHLQQLLDEAIADLQSGEKGTVMANSPANDVIFAGDAQRWIQACYSLKARLHMHWAEVDGSNYANAIAAAQSGISDWANSVKSFHTGNLNEEFGWYNFQSQRDSYIRAGNYMVTLLKDRNDPRLDIYFEPDAEGDYVGADPGENNTNASTLSLTHYLRPDKSFDLLTWEETQLIIAECAFEMGDEALARQKIDEVRRGVEQRYSLQEGVLGSVDDVSGAALFDIIMEEKYIALFLNVEVYNDWKRTGRPVLVPFGGGDPQVKIPHRLYYGSLERNSNPNIPVPSAQPVRNPNDPY